MSPTDLGREGPRSLAEHWSKGGNRDCEALEIVPMTCDFFLIFMRSKKFSEMLNIFSKNAGKTDKIRMRTNGQIFF